MNKLFMAILCTLPMAVLAYPDLPDPKLTPGALNWAVTQETIKTTICSKDYTHTIRPTSRYVTKVKLQQLTQNGPYRSSLPLTNFKEDHLISLELGGDPIDTKNLWPQLNVSSYKKDKLENALNILVCKGKVTLVEAQKAVSTNWIIAYTKYVKNK